MAAKQAVVATGVVTLSIASAVLAPPYSHPTATPPPTVELTALAEPIDFSVLGSDPALAQQLSDAIGAVSPDLSGSPAEAVPSAAFFGLGFLLRLPFLIVRLLRFAWNVLNSLWPDVSTSSMVAEALPAVSVSFADIPTGLPDTTFPDVDTTLTGPVAVFPTDLNVGDVFTALGGAAWQGIQNAVAELLDPVF